MTRATELLVKVALMVVIWAAWWWVLSAPASGILDVSLVVGGVFLAFPVVWLGRTMLDRSASTRRVMWTTTGVHAGLGFCLGVSIVRALVAQWPGPLLPVPRAVGLALVLVSGAGFLLTVLNLALDGLGAPFFIALSRKVATDWLYSRTRNPMVLAGLAFLVSLGAWYQSTLFVLWALLLLAPALIVFVRVYEERELELRFGASYLDYKSTTPMLLPSFARRPRRPSTR